MKAAGLFFALIVAIMITAAAVVWSWLPSEKEIKGCLVTTMYKVDLCPTSKNYVPLNRISSYLQKTIIMTEDGNFYKHHGFEWGVIEKNFRQGWETGVYKRGGSTITQQLAKNMFLNADRTFFRKGLEAIITDRIEKTLTKKEILERYLNVVEFGKNIYGVKAAANFYFKKEPAQLDVVESAFLAMVLPSPVKYSHSYYKKELTGFARKRMGQIVQNMYQFHSINEDEYLVAMERIQNFLSPAPPPDSLSGLENLSDEQFNNMSNDEINRLEQEIREEGTSSSGDLDISPDTQLDN
ncbi:monofunctional biosynthetic peptidoglycan transglycosylase [Bdellovibrio sp. HCB209]|uniref:monofunctional biosynthetic peptidoglycan transglycosylase n=1 Tax=Bdellovibrio sp. HCB209 TaxID=3394354 RepID=UPI0039B5426F